MAALLGAALCLHHACTSKAASSWMWWGGTGVCTGLALLSKYSAALTIVGAFLFLATEATERRWLRQPQIYIAAAIALAIFSPVLIWNAHHHWASFAFQGGRAAATHFHLLGPVTVLGGEALFLSPWIWLPLVLCTVQAVRLGTHDRRSWFLICLGLPPVVFFLVISFWSHVLFHWAAPGYLMLLPLLAEAIKQAQRYQKAIRISLWATGAAALLGILLVGSEVRFNWMPGTIEHFELGKDPDIDALDWTSVYSELAKRGLLDQPNLLLAGTRWFDAGKMDYALGGKVRIICLGDDPREYGVLTNIDSYVGHDILILGPRLSQQKVEEKFFNNFVYIEKLEPIVLFHAGQPAMMIQVFMGHHFLPSRLPFESKLNL